MPRTSVFVISGRNDDARRELFALLRAVHLQPKEWGHALREARSGSPFIGEVVKQALGSADAVIVLMTGDDVAKIRDELLNENEEKEKLTSQPRPNVLFEAGMAFGVKPDHTIIVQLGEMREISDIIGRHVVRLDNSFDKKKELIDRLADAGLDVDNRGNDWTKIGDFEKFT